MEVLALLRDRLTNEQIAERLGITLDGAKYHVSEILSKLGVGTREEAATCQPERRHWWQRLVALPLVAKVAGAATIAATGAAIGLMGLAVLATSGPGDEMPSPGLINAGSADNYPVGEPVYFDEGGFWLVRRESGEIIALSATDTHPVMSTFKDCLIEWHSDMIFDRRTGWFRGKCSGTTFGIDGQVAFGPSPRSMSRFPVTIDEEITVDTTVTLCGAGHIPPGSPC